MIRITKMVWQAKAEEFGEIYPVCPRCKEEWQEVGGSHVFCTSCAFDADIEKQTFSMNWVTDDEPYGRRHCLEWHRESEVCTYTYINFTNEDSFPEFSEGTQLPWFPFDVELQRVLDLLVVS